MFYLQTCDERVFALTWCAGDGVKNLTRIL